MLFIAKEDLAVPDEIGPIGKILETAGFNVFTNFKFRNFCFDIIARRENNLLILKVIQNIDRLKPAQTEELKFLTHILQATPIIIAERNRRDPLEDDTIYRRDEIIAINYKTFQNLIQFDRNPHIIAKRGGFIVRIDGPKLRRLREDANISRSTIAAELGVSKKAIVNYEQDRMNISLESVEVLKKRFQVDFTMPIEILQIHPKVELPVRQGESSFEKEIDQELIKIGLQTFWTKRAPFDLFLNQLMQKSESGKQDIQNVLDWNQPIITGVSETNKTDLQKKIEIVSKLSELKNKVLVIVDDASRIVAQGKLTVPVLEEGELKKLSSSKDFINLVDKRAQKAKQDKSPST